MTNIPKNRLDGYRWLIEVKKFELIKLRPNSETPVGAERGYATRTIHRSFKNIEFNKNHNAGVRTGRISGIIVLDIDNEMLFPNEYAMPLTFTVQTNKAVQHYFRLPDDGKEYKYESFKKLGYDIIGDEEYVLAPWSKHPDGPTYKVVNNAECAMAPEWLLELSEKSASNTKKKSPSLGKQTTPTPIVIPGGVKIPSKHKELVEMGVPKGERSERIWRFVNDLVEQEYSDDEIRWIFEKHPAGIGAKYLEKGANRVNWLQGKIDRAQKNYQGIHTDPVKAQDQGAVETVKSDILRTFRKDYNQNVSDDHGQVFENVVNLFIAMYEGSVTGWYAIPLSVGGGKTQIILHFIKFLYNHDTARSFSISVAFEKIIEIEDAARWLAKHGVSSEYFEVVHSQVPQLKEVYGRLKDAPVILHTHYKLKGSSYQKDYFSYKGNLRKILIFDESMRNSMISSEPTVTLVSRIDGFLREYDVNENFKSKIPGDVHRFFKELRTLIDVKEKELRKGTSKELRLSVDTSHLDLLDYSRLVSVSGMIEAELGKNDLFRDILLIGISPEKRRAFSLIMENSKLAFVACKELLSDAIENLITTDASRESRRLFKYTNRTDGKRIRIYKVGFFRWNDELYIKGIPLNSGQDSVKKAFNGDEQKNKYLDAIVDIVKGHNEHEATEKAMNHGVSNGERKYLFFHSKQIPTLPYQVREKLTEEGLVPVGEAKERLNFVTFGRENATNKYRDCDVVVFIGLLFKPGHAMRGLVAGEGYDGDFEAIKKDVVAGELIQQLQQGIGRGQMRRGWRQAVYFFHPKPLDFADDLEKAFPMCNFEGSTTYLPTAEEAAEMVVNEGFEDLDNNPPAGGEQSFEDLIK